MFSRIDHVGIVVTEFDNARQWYETQLGWTTIRVEYLEQVGVRLGYLQPSGAAEEEAAFLQLVQPVRPGPVMDHLRTHGEGMHHVCFAVDDMDEALRRLDEQDVRVFTGGRNRLACFLNATPNGCLIELTEAQPRLSNTQTPRAG